MGTGLTQLAHYQLVKIAQFDREKVYAEYTFSRNGRERQPWFLSSCHSALLRSIQRQRFQGKGVLICEEH